MKRFQPRVAGRIAAAFERGNRFMTVMVLSLAICHLPFSHVAAQEADSIPAQPQPVTTQRVSIPAQPQPVATQLVSIGFLSYNSALAAMPDYALVQARQNKLRQAYEEELKRVEEEFNQKYEAFLDGQRDFPRTILLKRQTELQQLLQKNIEFKRQGQKELEQAYEDALAPLRLKLDKAIAAVARKKGLALVVNTDSHACPFIDPDMGVDIQETVLDEVNGL